MNYENGSYAVARAPAHIRQAINRRRIEMGLEPVLADGELRAVFKAADAAMAAARARATREAAAGHRVVRRSPAPAAARTITRVIITAGYGLARCRADRSVVGEWIAHGAYGSPAELNRRGTWTLTDGHDGDEIEIAGDRLRAIHSTRAPLMLEWIPRLELPQHREIVARIEAGHTGASAQSIRWNTRTSRLPDPTLVVAEAGLVHVALLRNPERPAYPGSRATVFRDRPDTADELRRQVAAAEVTAMRCSGEAEAAFHRRRRHA